MTMVRFERENFKAKEELLHNEKRKSKRLITSIKTMREEEGEGEGEGGIWEVEIVGTPLDLNACKLYRTIAPGRYPVLSASPETRSMEKASQNWNTNVTPLWL